MLLHWLNHRAMLNKLSEVKSDVKTIEVATNSMKDALVKAARLEGKSEEREKQTDIDKAVAMAMSGPAAEPAPEVKKGKPGKLGDAIADVVEAAEETVIAAEKTVEHAEKVPRKP